MPYSSMLNIHDTNHTKANRPPLAMPLWSLEERQSTNKTSQKTLLQASISLSLLLFLHFSRPQILRLAQARLLGTCSSLPSQRQLALLSYFINYVNDVLPSMPATEHHQVPPLNACKWACLRAWADLRLSRLCSLPWFALRRVKQPGTSDPCILKQRAPWGSVADACMPANLFERVVDLSDVLKNLHFLTWTWSCSQRVEATA